MNATLIYRILIFLFALLSLNGLNIAFNPAGIDALFNLQLLDIDTNIGLRADLGGFFVGGGILLAYGAYKTQGVWLRAVAVLIACILVSRIYGAFVHEFTQTQGMLILVEIVMIAVYLLAARNFDQASAQS